MTETPKDLITRALRLINVISPYEVPSPEQLETGRLCLNEFLDELGIHRQAIYEVQRVTEPLVAGTQTYTIGPGGDINRERPVWISLCGLIYDRTASPPHEEPIGRPLTIEEWASVRMKTSTSDRPRFVFYDHANVGGLGTISVHPVQTQSLSDLVLYIPTALGEFTEAVLDTPFVFPKGWVRMLRLNLAVTSAPEFQREASIMTVAGAMSSLAAVKRANLRVKTAGLPVNYAVITGGHGYGYDIRSDT